MAVDLYPYSQRSDGLMTDANHEDLWSAAADGILPGQAANAALTQISGGTWVVYPGKVLIRGHVLNITSNESGALPSAGASTITSVVVAYVNRNNTPWTYGCRLVTGTPGGGRPALTQSTTGLYEVPLRAFTTAPGGATTLLEDERLILTAAGSPLLRAQANTSTTIPATITGAPGQATSLLRIRQNPTGDYVFAVSQDGHVGVADALGASDLIALRVKPSRDDAVALRLDAAGAQSADLLQIYNAAGGQVVRVDKDGNLSAANLATTDWATYDPNPQGGGTATYTSRTGRWRRIGYKTVTFRSYFIIGVAGSGTTEWNWQLPTIPSRSGRQVFHGHTESPGSVLEAVTFDTGSGTTVNRTLQVNASITKNLTGSDLAPGMILTISGTYEEA